MGRDVATGDRGRRGGLRLIRCIFGRNGRQGGGILALMQTFHSKPPPRNLFCLEYLFDVI